MAEDARVVHAVQPGECLASIARQYGFPNWRTLYDAPENAALRNKRPNPNVLATGDEVCIPAKRPRVESGASDQRHSFRVKSARWVFRLDMKDDEGTPQADLPWELWLDGGGVCRGRTNQDGRLEARVPADVRGGRLILAGEEMQVVFGGLDPVGRVSGIQQRLNNLGYCAGAVDGRLGPHTAAALRSFQRAQGLPVTAEADDATRRRLGEVHDGDSRVGEMESSPAPAAETAAPGPQEEQEAADEEARGEDAQLDDVPEEGEGERDYGAFFTQRPAEEA
jgi:N-acetylmuramoyl-L-alanine amidase